MQIRCRKLCVLASMDINVLYTIQAELQITKIRSYFIFFFWAKIGRPLSSCRHQNDNSEEVQKLVKFNMSLLKS